MDTVARAGGPITRPREQWAAIAGGPSSTAELLKGHVVPVSAIPAVAGFVGFAAFALVPPLAVLALLGLRSLYRGVPVVAGVPEGRALVSTSLLVMYGLASYVATGFVLPPPALAM